MTTQTTNTTNCNSQTGTHQKGNFFKQEQEAVMETKAKVVMKSGVANDVSALTLIKFLVGMFVLFGVCTWLMYCANPFVGTVVGLFLSWRFVFQLLPDVGGRLITLAARRKEENREKA